MSAFVPMSSPCLALPLGCPLQLCLGSRCAVTVLLNVHERFNHWWALHLKPLPSVFSRFCHFQTSAFYSCFLRSPYSSVGSHPQEHCCTDCLNSCHRVPARELTQTDATQHKLNLQHYFFFIRRKNLKACSVPTTTV